MTYSIIIPTYRNLNEFLKPCLESIAKYTTDNYEVIVVGNGCDLEEFQSIVSKYPTCKPLWFENPLGYTKAVNQGLKVASGDYIILLNDDTTLLPQPKNEWLNLLTKPFLQDSKVGITGPVKFNWDCGGINREAMAFWLVMIPKRIFNELGHLDEIFSPGMGEDGDFSIRVVEAGYKLVSVPDDKSFLFSTGTGNNIFPIWHKGNGTFGEDHIEKNKIILRNNKILEERWGLKKDKTGISKSLQAEYDHYCKEVIDLHEHMPTLKRYAQECSHITELGTRFVVSAYAFMMGKPKKLVTYDIVVHPNIWKADSIAKENGIEFAFMERDTTNTEIEPTDLLFVDSKHSYLQVKTELALHAGKVRKYIIFHDTVSYAYHDEDAPTGGIMPAINEFLASHPEWKIKENYTNCNGLMIIERVALDTVSNVKYSIVIPTYNHCDDLLKPCLESIAKYTDLSNVEVIVVANGCVDNTKEYVESLGHPFKLIWIEEPAGYTKATNQGILQAKGEYVILLNNDTELLPQGTNTWLNMLEGCFTDSKVGLSGPLQLHDEYADFDVLIFFCVMVKRELFDKIGLLDEIFAPGGGEDIDFTVRANLAGYKSVALQSHFSPEAGTNVGTIPIWHKDNKTFGEIPEYTKVIVKRNGLINCKRYNKNIKLNVGSGGIEFPGYLSVDLYDQRANIIMDITKLDFDPNSVTEILASHVFEHLNPYHCFNILQNWFSVLKPGGKLVMEMPNIEEVCKEFLRSDKSGKYNMLNCMYGSVNTTGEGGEGNPLGLITSPHLFGWWPESLYDHLSGVGFTDITFMSEQIPHPGPNLRVEATKPMV